MTVYNAAPPAHHYWTTFKWSAMAFALFWTFVYRLSQEGIELSGFVYVNF